MARLISSRNTPADDTVVNAVFPVFKAEMARKLWLDYKCMTRGTGFGGIAGTASSFPDQYNEVNVHGLWVPWEIAVTHQDSTTQNTTALSDLATEDWDPIFKNLMFEWSATGSEYYGGSDYERDALDYNERTSQNENSTGSSPQGADASTPVSERGSFGPLGIVRLFGQEVFMENMVSDGDGKVRQGHNFQGSMDLKGLNGPGFIVIGTVRYKVNDANADKWNYDVENAATRMARNALIGGDLQRVQDIIERDQGVMGDWVRTMLFGGDTYIGAADTLKENDAKSYAKAVFTVETPYRLTRF